MVQVQGVQAKTLVMTGGLNEIISGLELKPGELIECTNYVEQDDVYHGYTSAQGYERFDGTATPSSVALDNADPPIDTAREARRTAIDAPTGSGQCRGVHVYNDKVYCWRDNAGGTANQMFVADATVGWGNGSVADTAISGTSMDDSGTVRAVNGRFSLYNSNQEIMVFVDGVSQPHIYNGSSITVLDMTSVVGAGVFPVHVGIWRNRLFLVYLDGHVVFSKVGTPIDFDSSTGIAGEIFLGEDVTDFQEAPGGVLVFFTQKSIQVLTYGTTDENWIFKLDNFSLLTGAKTDTVQNMLGTLYFADDQGLASLGTVANFGDFSAKNIGKKVQNTYNTNKSRVTFSTVERGKNRLYLFFNTANDSTSSALVYTFRDKRIKGATVVRYNHKLTALTEGSLSDGTNKIYFGDDNGLVFEMLSGTSFDGEDIPTKLRTSFHNYGSSRLWKSFRKLFFEMTGDDDTTMQITTDYDYADRKISIDSPVSKDVDGAGSKWGTGIWATFTWSAKVISSAILYIQGLGANMSITMTSSSKYKNPHTVHNITVDYLNNGIQQ